MEYVSLMYLYVVLEGKVQLTENMSEVSDKLSSSFHLVSDVFNSLFCMLGR